MKYIIDVPESRVEDGRLRIMAEMEDCNPHWIETGITAKQYHGDGDEAEKRGIEKDWKLAQAYEAWMNQKDEIKVGDEIIYDFEKAIVLDVVNGSCFIMTSNGYVTAIKKENIRKTGRHFDTVDLIVKKLKESS